MPIVPITDFVPSPVLTKDANGIVRGIARISRAGVQYYHVDEIRRFLDVPSHLSGYVGVLRPPDKTEETAHLFDATPIILNHQWVNENNVEQLTGGWSGKTVYINGWVEVPTCLFKKELIDAASSTHKEFSNAYNADWIYQEGQWIDELGIQGEKGKSYDYAYVAIPVEKNHIGLVKTGTARAGREATFIADSIPIYDSVLGFTDEDQSMDLKDMIPMKMGDMTGYLPDGISQFLSSLLSGLGEVSTELELGDLQELSIGDASCSVPKSMKDMMTKMKDMYGKKAMDSFPDMSQFIALDAHNVIQSQLSESRQQLAEARAKLATQEVAITSYEKQVMDATSPEKINQLLKERTDAYNAAKPFLTDCEFDPTLDAKEWQKKALIAFGQESQVVDSYDDKSLNAAFETMQKVKPTVQDKSSQVTDTIARQRGVTSDNNLPASQVVYRPVLPQNRPINPIN